MAGYLLIRRLTASVTGPLKTLSASMALASDGDFDLVLECMGDDFSQDEVGQLASEYREMIIRIQKLIRENYEKQLLLNDSRYRMLRPDESTFPLQHAELCRLDDKTGPSG